MARLEFRYGDMTQPRSTCPVMRSGDGRRPVLGQRTAFGRGAGSVNSATLVQRLSRLEQAGLVRKTVRSTMPPRTTYELTESGRALEPVIDALARWAEQYGVEEVRSEG